MYKSPFFKMCITCTSVTLVVGTNYPHTVVIVSTFLCYHTHGQKIVMYNTRCIMI